MSFKIPNIDHIWQRDPLLAEALQALRDGVDTLGTKISVNPQGQTSAPAPPSAISVTTNASGIHRISWTDNNPRTRHVHYFHEWDTNPNFTNPQPTHVGVSRQLSIPIAAGSQAVYHRVSAQYPDGDRSEWVYFGSPSKPTPVVDGASMAGPTPHPSTGSGTSSVGGHGFGQEKFVSPPQTPGKPPKAY